MSVMIRENGEKRGKMHINSMEGGVLLLATLIGSFNNH